MFCPNCGQQQVSEETRFCSRCGFLLTSVSALIRSNGLPSQNQFIQETRAISPRKRGFKQGGLMMLLSLIIIPLVALLVQAVRAPEEIIAVVAIITFWGGILRMLFALFFESKVPDASLSENVLPEVVQNMLPTGKKSKALPPEQAVPVSAYSPSIGANWRDTKDLVQPSVTENTTRLLEKDK